MLVLPTPENTGWLEGRDIRLLSVCGAVRGCAGCAADLLPRRSPLGSPGSVESSLRLATNWSARHSERGERGRVVECGRITASSRYKKSIQQGKDGLVIQCKDHWLIKKMISNKQNEIIVNRKKNLQLPSYSHNVQNKNFKIMFLNR